MKKAIKFLIIIMAISFMQPCFADNSDVVVLDVSQVKPEIVHTYINKEYLNTTKTFTPDVKTRSHEDLYDTDRAYQKKTTSYKKSKKFKNGEAGVQYDTTFSSDSASQTRTLYSNYNINSKTSVNTSYSNSNTGSASNQMKGTVSVAPEYRLNKNFAVQNKFSKNMNNGSTKEEVSVKMNPFKDTDRMDINVGAGQVQYTNGAPSSSQINFGTNFKF